jgi:hypothetical protein
MALTVNADDEAKSIMKLPRWDCQDEDDLKRLEAWTNARLDETELEAADPADFMPDDEASAVAISKFFGQMRERGRLIGRLIVAVRAKDIETVARLADTVELRRLVQHLQHPGTGNVRGDRPDDDLSDLERCLCEDAANDMKRIKLIWQQHYPDKRARNADPTANDIAARRCGIEPNTLNNYRKNRHRKSR